MSWRVTFEIIGYRFSPNKLDFKFHDQNEANDIATSGRFKGSEFGYGSASYLVDDKISRLNKFKHLADTFEPLLDMLKLAGAESWHISIGRLYSAQCNEELDSKEIKEIARLKCTVSYSAYLVSEKEELKGFEN